MSDLKMSCPACGSWTNAVGQAAADGEPCPNCGGDLPRRETELDRLRREVERIPRIEKMARDANRECIKHWNRADAAEAALDRVREVHGVSPFGDDAGPFCEHCTTEHWPCPTIRAIDTPAVPTPQPEETP